MQKVAFTLTEGAIAAPIMTPMLGGLGGLAAKVTGQTGDDVGYLEALKRGTIGGARDTGIPAAMLSAGGIAAGAPLLSASSMLLSMLHSPVAGFRAAANQAPEKAAGFSTITPALAKLIREAGGRGALGKAHTGIATEAKAAEGKLIARSQLFGGPKPNLQVVPGIEDNLDTIIKAG